MRNASVTGVDALDDLQQTVVLDHDQRVDVLAEGLGALLGLLGAELALERERPGHDADRECAELAPDLERRRARRRCPCHRPRRP